MKNAGYGVAIVGVILVVLGLLNHYVIHQNPILHTSTWLAGTGAVVAVIGLILTYLASRNSAA